MVVEGKEMFIKRNLRFRGAADITRRSAIAGIAAGVAGAMLESPARGQRLSPSFDQNKLVISTPSTNLWMADMYGNQLGNPLGVVLACPQSCAAARPGYAEALAKPGLNAIYLNTSEWMREIIYTPDLTVVAPDPDRWRSYRRQMGFYRVTNDNYTAGCGHISRNATVTQVTIKSGKFVASMVGEGFSSVAAKGGTGSNGLYVATDIYIFQGDWAPLDSVKTPVLYGVVGQIGKEKYRPLDVSACPAPSLPYPQ
jgi:hypothetical protein